MIQRPLWLAAALFVIAGAAAKADNVPSEVSSNDVYADDVSLGNVSPEDVYSDDVYSDDVSPDEISSEPTHMNPVVVSSGAVFAPLRIGRITIHRKNIFETGTKWDHVFPYSLANKVHVVTKESFIRRELLFKEGDPYDPAVVEESERILRGRSLLRFVKITPQPPVNGIVDVLIETDDVWTTSIDISYGLAGGKQTYNAGFLERNFLCQGQRVGA